MKQFELIPEYRLSAITLFSLELVTNDAGNKMGELRAKREKDPKLESTAQAKSNFVLQQVQQAMALEKMALVEEPKKAKAERAKQMKQLRRDRDLAKNIALFIGPFDWGIVPLLVHAPWKKV